MSFDIFFQIFYGNDDAMGVSLEIIEREFGRYTVKKEPKCWILAYPGGGRCELYVDSAQAFVDHFMIARPPNSPEFWRSLFVILNQTSGCLHWPGGGCVIAQPSVRDYLPSRMLKGLGEPIVVRTPEQILDAMEKD
jgi:hypothetical protein